MKVTAIVIKEFKDKPYRSKGGQEIQPLMLTCMEQPGPEAMSNTFDYGLRDDEREHFGKLTGKTVQVVVETVAAIFSGRPRFRGHLIVNGK